jgi:hypothetical protein
LSPQPCIGDKDGKGDEGDEDTDEDTDEADEGKRSSNETV